MKLTRDEKWQNGALATAHFYLAPSCYYYFSLIDLFPADFCSAHVVLRALSWATNYSFNFGAKFQR